MSKRIVSVLTVACLVLTLVFAAGTAFAQTADMATTTATSSATVSTPDVPNTGAGDHVMNIALLVVSGIAVAFGVSYLNARKTV